MSDSVASISNAAATAVVTYLLHSSLLLLSAWLVLRVTRAKSHALTEQVWKAAAVAGLMTATAHLSLGIASPVFQLPLAFESPNALSFAEDDPHPAPRETLSNLKYDTDIRSRYSAPSVQTKAEIIERDSSVLKIPLKRVAPSNAENFSLRTDDVVIAQSQELPAAENTRVPKLNVAIPSRNDELTFDARLPDSNVVPKGTASSEETSAIASTKIVESILEFLQRWSLVATIVGTVAIVLLLLGRLLLQTMAFGRRVARLQPLESVTARTLLDQLLRQAGIRRRANLFTSNAYSEPVAFGVFRWRIVLPAGLDRELPREELRALLAHELAHLVRGDTIWLWIGHVLCSLLAFQPLNFLARRRWRQAAEFQCDDWAVRHAVAPLALARCLTRVAERRQTRRACFATLAAIGAKSTLSNRVERLVQDTNRNDPWLRGRRRRLIELSSIVVISGLAIWGPSATMPAQSQVRNAATSENVADSRETIVPKIDITRPTIEIAKPRDSAKPLDKESTAVTTRGAAELSNKFINGEISVLRQELSDLVAETKGLSQDLHPHPELRPLVDRLLVRIGELQRRIDQLDSQRSQITHGPSSN